MIDQVKEHLQKVSEFNSTDVKTIEEFRISYLGKKGILTDFFAAFRDVAPSEKKAYGLVLNQLKTALTDKVKELQSKANGSTKTSESGDLTRPGFQLASGNRHPLSVVKNRIVAIFSQIGFTISEGPEIEDDWHNFTALNLPERTHTSSVQVRYMEKNQPPIRTISPGRVFRNEAISARSHCIFHQIEGLYIDKDVSFTDLKQTLLYFTESLFGNSKIRLRPSYFPFTEPSAEVDIYWGLETEVDYRITKGTGWLEIMGCGMVDPNVLDNCGIDSKAYSGFAFGMGIERIAMLLYQIGDIRYFFENDIRFLKQFKATL